MQISVLPRFVRRTAMALVIVLTAISQPALAQDSAAATHAETNANIAVVKKFIVQVVNGGHFELVDQLWAKDKVWHGAKPGEMRGIDTYKKAMQSAVGKSFSNMHLDIKDVIASGDKVVVHFTNSGTNTGPFLGLPATGKHAVWEGIGIYKVINGKVAEAWFVEDILGQQQQLGNWHRCASLQ